MQHKWPVNVGQLLQKATLKKAPETPVHASKIFGIGFQKTGTTSLKQALKVLGYRRVAGPNWINDPNIQETVFEKAFAAIDKFDAFQDNPWPVLYKEIAERYPSSKFILTKRPVDEWIGSVAKHFGTNTTPMRTWIYGAGNPVGNEGKYIERYIRHNNEVEAYFEGQPERLLVMSITQGDGWDLLCPFLDKSVPDIMFPHANTSEGREDWGIKRLRRERT